MDALLENAEKSLGETRTKGQDRLKVEAAELVKNREFVESVRDLQTEIAAQESSVQGTRIELESVLGGLSCNELRSKLADAKFRASTDSVKDRIVQDAIFLFGRDESEKVSCPICDSHHNLQKLQSTLQIIAKSAVRTA